MLFRSPQKCWWASEIDLSAVESVIAQSLISNGYEIIEPSVLNKTIAQDPAFRVADISEPNAIALGNVAAANYVIVGKALATSGGNVPQSNMKSCFANITAKLIRTDNGKVLAYLDASGNSAHLDVITGGKEALKRAGQDLSGKIVDSLNKQSQNS